MPQKVQWCFWPYQHPRDVSMRMRGVMRRSSRCRRNVRRYSPKSGIGSSSRSLDPFREGAIGVAGEHRVEERVARQRGVAHRLFHRAAPEHHARARRALLDRARQPQRRVQLLEHHREADHVVALPRDRGRPVLDELVEAAPESSQLQIGEALEGDLHVAPGQEAAHGLLARRPRRDVGVRAQPLAEIAHPRVLARDRRVLGHADRGGGLDVEMVLVHLVAATAQRLGQRHHAQRRIFGEMHRHHDEGYAPARGGHVDCGSVCPRLAKLDEHPVGIVHSPTAAGEHGRRSFSWWAISWRKRGTPADPPRPRRVSRWSGASGA
jgi:hypothetical protein